MVFEKATKYFTILNGGSKPHSPVAVESGDLLNPLQCAKLQLLHSHRVDTLQSQQCLNLQKYELLESTSSIPSRNGLLGWPILLPSTILCLLQRDGNTNI